jgi:hypothetical protein
LEIDYNFLGLNDLDPQIGHACRETKRRSKVSKIVDKLTSIGKYAAVLDVFVQQHPVAVSILWGCIRFLISVSYPYIKVAATRFFHLANLTNKGDNTTMSVQKRYHRYFGACYFPDRSIWAGDAIFLQQSSGFGSNITTLHRNVEFLVTGKPLPFEVAAVCEPNHRPQA